MTRNHGLARVTRLISRALGWLGTLLVAYAAAGLAGGAVPVNAGWRQAGEGVRIYVADNGIHTDIILPVAAEGIDWRTLVRADALRDPRYAGHSHVAFGWGDRAFYVGTPTWRDLSLRTVLYAAIGSEDTVLHVTHLPEPTIEPGVRSLVLRPEEYRRLAAFLRGSFQTGPDGRAGSVLGYGRSDAFYAARGRYSALRTCNAWTGEALRHAGVRMGAWTPFTATVMGWL